MRICPRCKSDCTSLESSREMQVSNISCDDCDFGFSAPVSEVCIEKMWEAVIPEECADLDEDDEEQEDWGDNSESETGYSGECS